MSDRCFAALVVSDNFLYVGTGAQGGPDRPLFAVRPGASCDFRLVEGQSHNASVTWLPPTGLPFMRLPPSHCGRLHPLFDNGILSVCLAIIYGAFFIRTMAKLYRIQAEAL